MQTIIAPSLEPATQPTREPAAVRHEWRGWSFFFNDGLDHPCVKEMQTALKLAGSWRTCPAGELKLARGGNPPENKEARLVGMKLTNLINALYYEYLNGRLGVIAEEARHAFIELTSISEEATENHEG